MLKISAPLAEVFKLNFLFVFRIRFPLSSPPAPIPPNAFLGEVYLANNLCLPDVLFPLSTLQIPISDIYRAGRTQLYRWINNKIKIQ